MTPGRMSESLADAHRRELLREAQQAALAAEATAEASGIWTAALLVVADLLMAAGQRLRARLGRGQVAHAHHAHHAPYAPYRVDGLCRGRAECEGVVWLDV